MGGKCLLALKDLCLSLITHSLGESNQTTERKSFSGLMEQWRTNHQMVNQQWLYKRPFFKQKDELYQWTYDFEKEHFVYIAWDCNFECFGWSWMVIPRPMVKSHAWELLMLYSEVLLLQQSIWTLGYPQSNVYCYVKIFPEPLPTSHETLQPGKRVSKISTKKAFLKLYSIWIL